MSLQTVINDFQTILKRDDCTNDDAALYIRHAMERLQDEIRVPSMERTVTTTMTATGDTISIPADLLQLIDIYVEDGSSENPRAMNKVSSRDLMLYSTTAVASCYARIGASWRFKGSLAVNAIVSQLYYAKFRTITDYAEDNEATAGFPMVLVYGALSFAADAFSHPAGPRWEQRYTQLRDNIILAASELEANGGPSSIQAMYQEPSV